MAINLTNPMTGDVFKTEMENALDKRGDTMVDGATLTLGKNPENDMDAVTKQYLHEFQKPWDLDGVVGNISEPHIVQDYNYDNQNIKTITRYIPMINSGTILLDFVRIYLYNNSYTSSSFEIYLNDVLERKFITSPAAGYPGFKGEFAESLELSVNKGDKIILKSVLDKGTGSSTNSIVEFNLTLKANIDTPYKYLGSALYNYTEE